MIRFASLGWVWVFTVAAMGSELTGSWPAWRGPSASGSTEGNPPVSWSETNHIRWKVEIPGKGHSSPIVWKDRIYLTTAIPTDQVVDSNRVAQAEQSLPEFRRAQSIKPDRVQRFVVLAVHRQDGTVAWQTEVCQAAPHEGTHADGSWASASPCTDGERVYAFFGSRGLYCLDLTGKILWHADWGPMKVKMSFGEGSSPALCGDRIVLTWDHEGECFVVALDKRTGRELWRAPRQELTSWATPLFVPGTQPPQVVVNATTRIRSYNAADGAVVWECGGMTTNVIPSPVLVSNLVICASGFRGSAMKAVRLDSARGDVTGSADAIAWSLDQDTPYVPSLLVTGPFLYFLKGNAAELSCFDALRGTAHYRVQNLDDLKPVYSSPVAAGGHVYVTGKNGVTAVLRIGPRFEVVARNRLDDRFTASAAIVGDEIYLRGHRWLYSLGSVR
jgi:outer membrane protein assembly factor BamB